MAMRTWFLPKVIGSRYRAYPFFHLNHPIILRRAVAWHCSWNPVYERWCRTRREIHQPVAYWDSRRGWSRVFQICPMVLILPGSRS